MFNIGELKKLHNILMVKEKEFIFEIDGTSFIKWFKPDTKLEDVRKKLAEGQDGWDAEKLLFKQGKIQIYHEDEIHYKLEKIQSRISDKYIIYVENLMKKVKTHVDDEVFSLSLDPNDKLEKIRISLLGNFANLFTKEFNFRWKNGRIVDKCEEITNNLEEILMNNNELYISILQESEITICSSHGGDFEQSIHTLHKGKKLTEIREELEQCLCPDFCFLNLEKARIHKSAEDKLMLGQILLIGKNGQNVLNIRREHDYYDLVKLMNKCGYGFIIKNSSVEQAEYRAFTITKTPDQHIFENKYDEGTLKCKNEFHELCERNFITFINATFTLPWVSAFFGVNREVSLKKLENYEDVTEYSYIKMRRVSVNISKNVISVNKEFSDDVEKALEEKTQDKRVESLKKIAEKYGYFYANSVYFGGVIVKKKEKTKYSNEHSKAKKLEITAKTSPQKIIEACTGSNSKICQNIKTVTDNSISGGTIKGGDLAKFSFDKFVDCHDWINSLKDPETWGIIEYHHINSIFSLLDEDLQTKVLEALGKRILRAEVNEIMYQTEKEQYIYELAEKLSDIPNIKDCQIFTTIMKEKMDRHIFSTCVSYDGSSDKPIIIINRTPSKKKPKRKYIPVRIGWIIVGYPTDTFDFDLSNQVVIESRKCGLKQYTINNNDFPHLNNLQFIKKYALATCVLDKVETTTQENASNSSISSISVTSQLNARELKLVVGSYFSRPLDSACLFAYCSKDRKKQLSRKDDQNDSFLQHLKLFIW
ncbi:11079_t:CDS:2 [Dentiscutata heterogama]|uniref:11079_t:CDS:1 n=1 Tax=Dentiscutata heterogama TaxID=1316150 RepID=A0ACA9M2R3_9GLOM|nr:11079_t:CDS:2 [Dentiscutata heterogama]